MFSTYAKLPEIVLIADPKVTSINIQENNEPLVDILKQTDIKYGPSPEIPNNTNYTLIRKTVYEKLKKANTLLPKGMYFCLYEGYRSIELQKKLFEAQYKNVKTRHPNWSTDNIFNETIKLISPVINNDGSKNIPPHSTGGAIDVYLIDANGKAFDMGIHPKDWMQDKDASLSQTDSKIISKEAQKNRNIMSQALNSVGFVNYPTEYWHWSYGDKYWAFVKKEPYAIYGTWSQ